MKSFSESAVRPWRLGLPAYLSTILTSSPVRLVVSSRALRRGLRFDSVGWLQRAIGRYTP